MWAEEKSAEREALIYGTMFPGSAVEWEDYAVAANADIDDKTSKAYMNWRKQMMDTQAFWAHDFNDRDIFVTSDNDFRPLEGHPDFPKAVIRNPREAAELL